MNYAKRRLRHGRPGRWKILDLSGAGLVSDGSDRSVDTGPDKENKPCSPLSRLLRNGCVLLNFTYRRDFPAHAFRSLSCGLAHQVHGTEASV